MKNSFPFAAPSRRAGAWLSLILFPVVGGVGPLAWAQPSPIPRPEVWRPDGPVLAIAVDGDLAYLGGSFAYLGPPSGSAAVVSRAEAAPSVPFPALDGTVSAVTDDGGGGWFLGGSFLERVTGQPNLLHVAADGSVDVGWRPEVSGTVRALLRDRSALYVGGGFSKVNGESRSGLVRFEFPSGSLATWNPSPNNEVHALARDGARLFVGGAFTSFAKQSRGRLAAVNLDTGVVTPFNPGASGSGAVVRALAVAENTLFVGGEFTTCGGKPRSRLAAVDTRADTGNALDWNPGAGGDVYCLLAAGATVYVGGEFTTVGGANRNRIAALSAGSNLALADWNPGADGTVYSLAIDADGLWVGGAFTTLGVLPRPGAGRIHPESGEVLAWAPRISMLGPTGNPVVQSVVPTERGVLIAGTFASLGGVARSHLAALDLVSGRATEWNPGAGGEVMALALSETAVFAGGRFTNIAGTAHARLASLDRATGAANPLVADVSASASYGVYALLHSAGRLFVGGRFSAINGRTRANLGVVNDVDGSVDATWDPAPNGTVLCLALGGSNLYVGGSFSSLGGSNRTGLGVVSVSGSGRSTAVLPRAGDDVRALVLAGDRLYVGGDFGSIGGAPRRRFAVLEATSGDAVATWNPDVASPSGTYYVQAIALSGRVAYAGGVFTTAGGEFRTRLAGIHRLDAMATVWNPGANAVVRQLAYGTGHLVAAGDFTQIGGKAVGYLAVFSTRPFIPSGGLRTGPGGAMEVTVWEGDVPAGSIALQCADRASEDAWTDLQSLAAEGRPRTFTDGGSPDHVCRFYRAVAR